MSSKIKITLTKSGIGFPKNQKNTLRALGLRKLNGSVVHEDTPSIRGMLYKVRHLVTIEEA